MSQKILPKIGIILLAIALYCVIAIPAEIRVRERAVKAESQEKLTVLYEAEKHYRRKFRRYTDNFEELLAYVKSDTVIFQKKRLVDFTNVMVAQIETYASSPAPAGFLKIKASMGYVKIIMDEVKDEYRSTPAIAELAEHIYNKIDGSLTNDNLKKYNNVLFNMDSIFQVKIDIEEHKLQEAAAYLVEYSDYVLENITDVELSEAKSFWLGIDKDLAQLEKLLNGPGMKPQVKSDRYSNQAGVIRENIARIMASNLTKEKVAVEKEHAGFVRLRGMVTDSEHYVISQQSGKLRLSESEEFLVKMDATTKLAPPLKKDYVFELTSNGFKISCPNKRGEIAENVVFAQKYENYGFVTNSEKSWDK